jgi:hypothetical protein
MLSLAGEGHADLGWVKGGRRPALEGRIGRQPPLPL